MGLPGSSLTVGWGRHQAPSIFEEKILVYEDVAAVPGNLHNAITDVYLGFCPWLASFAASGSATAGVQAQPCDVSTVALGGGAGGVGAAGGGTASAVFGRGGCDAVVVDALGGGGGCG